MKTKRKMSGKVLATVFAGTMMIGLAIGGGVFAQGTTSPPTTPPASTCGTGFALIGGLCMPTTTGLPTSSVGQIIMNVMSWLLSIFGMAAIIAFVVSGIQYLTAAGDDNAIQKAKTNMKWSIVGVAVGLSGWIVVNEISCLFGGDSFLCSFFGGSGPQCETGFHISVDGNGGGVCVDEDGNAYVDVRVSN